MVTLWPGLATEKADIGDSYKDEMLKDLLIPSIMHLEI